MSSILRTPSTAERRRSLATVMRLVSIPVVLALVAFGVKLVAMTIISAMAISAYNAGDFERSAQYSRWNLTANVIEPYRAHFNVGTAYLQLELYQDAREELETALETAPAPESCDVRLNLSYAIEGLGDIANGAGRFDEAVTLYEEALAVLAEADDSCPPNEERQDELNQKLEQAQQNADPEGNPQGGPNGPNPGGQGEDEADGPIDSLEDLLEQAQRDKELQDSADRSHDNFDDFVDKPW